MSASGHDALRRVAVVLTTRGVGLESLFTGLPLALLVGFAALTQLGDVWFYFLTLATAYWVGDTVAGSDRRHAAFLLGCALTALALSTTLKGYFALPRPPGAGVAVGADRLPGALRAFYVDAATADGTGFPSGHALGAALVWGGAALTLETDRRTRLAGGAAVVLLVGLSRVGLGVHYLVDVLAGWAIGGAALTILLRVGGDRNPGRVFSLAALVALAGAVANFDATHLTALGATLGARISWGAVGEDALRAPTSLRSGLVLTAVGLPVLGGPFFYLYAVEPGPTVAFAASAVITASVLVLPLVGDVVRKSI
ncbi:phosphatase PAP2 family protein [Haloglomus salinum]|jgi:membrane-associated phospholipid phosphatase|uniref:phosphatase PAP2 family protein n=1 Tax=Haloglomus salinum TaxID=2962673 RepID=UPI0020CA0356|nr:phosphatase PAP2 family protein [Haloglomus salinum]